MHLASVLTALALKYITDDQKRQEFAEGVSRLSRGEPIELEPGVVLGTKR
jgi:hypothetical protein